VQQPKLTVDDVEVAGVLFMAWPWVPEELAASPSSESRLW
jgi:hypothetical protein